VKKLINLDLQGNQPILISHYPTVTAQPDVAAFASAAGPTHQHFEAGSDRKFMLRTKKNSRSADVHTTSISDNRITLALTPFILDRQPQRETLWAKGVVIAAATLCYGRYFWAA
jgi:hypothetical protein